MKAMKIMMTNDDVELYICNDYDDERCCLYCVDFDGNEKYNVFDFSFSFPIIKGMVNKKFIEKLKGYTNLGYMLVFQSKHP